MSSLARITAATLGLLFAVACGREASQTLDADQAPRFQLPTAEGGSVSLDRIIGDRPALLYFSMGPG